MKVNIYISGSQPRAVLPSSRHLSKSEDTFDQHDWEPVLLASRLNFLQCTGQPHSKEFVVDVVWLLSCVQLFAAPLTVFHQVLLSMGFPRQEHWSGLPLPRPGNLSNTGIKPTSPALQPDSLPLSHWECRAPNVNSSQIDKIKQIRSTVFACHINDF